MKTAVDPVRTTYPMNEGLDQSQRSRGHHGCSGDGRHYRAALDGRYDAVRSVSSKNVSRSKYPSQAWKQDELGVS